jgi:polyhydroxybutyrate depolymerase
MTDSIQILGFLFLGNPESIGCEDVADVDDNGAVDISDGIYILNFLFVGGPRPPQPYPRLGFDRTVDDPFPCGDIIGGPQRPVDLDVNGGLLHVPSGYNADTPTPLVLLLHGDPGTGYKTEQLANFTPLSDREGFLYVYPTGGIPGCFGSERGWDVSENGLDSVYLQRVIVDMRLHFNVDSKRVYVIGASAGGHMAYRMACDHPDTLAGIIVNSGVMPQDVATCNPTSPVHVLHVHCTGDPNVPYSGGNVYCGAVQLGAPQSVRQWAEYNGCSSEPVAGPRMDYDPSPTDDFETRTEVYPACSEGGSAELWTLEKTCHVPLSGGRFPWLVWMNDHPKP